MPSFPTIALLASVTLLLGLGLVMADGRDQPVSDTDPPGPSAGTPVMGKVTGIVTRADGTPAPGLNVQATSLDDPPLPVPEIGVLTGTDGSYEWTLRAGDYAMTVLTPNSRGTGKTTVVAGQTVTVNLRVP